MGDEAATAIGGDSLIARGSWHWQYAGDLRQAFTQIAFDAMMQRHCAAGAAMAGTVEADVDGAVTQHIDQFDVTAIGLNRGTNQVDDFLDAFPQFGTAGGRGYRSGCWHKKESYRC